MNQKHAASPLLAALLLTALASPVQANNFLIQQQQQQHAAEQGRIGYCLQTTGNAYCYRNHSVQPHRPVQQPPQPQFHNHNRSLPPPPTRHQPTDVWQAFAIQPAKGTLVLFVASNEAEAKQQALAACAKLSAEHSAAAGSDNCQIADTFQMHQKSNEESQMRMRLAAIGMVGSKWKAFLSPAYPTHYDGQKLRDETLAICQKAASQCKLPQVVE